MNGFIEQLNVVGEAYVQFAGTMLLQSCVLIGLLLAADLLLKRRVRAVVRYWIWMLVLVKLMLPVTLSSPVGIGRFFGESLTQIDISKLDSADSQPKSVRPEPADMPFNLDWDAAGSGPAWEMPQPLPTTENTSTVRVTAQIPGISWQAVLLILWLVVAAIMLVLLVQRMIFVRQLVRQAQKPDRGMEAALQRCKQMLGIKTDVGLKVSANATSPAVCGLLRPVILIPLNLRPALGTGKLRAVLLHELAHIKRRDLWVNMVQTLLQIAYFYNPLLWLANAIIRRVREKAVDETVLVAMGTDAPRYPETLVSVAKLAFERPALSLRLIGVVESRSALKSRLRHIIDRPLPASAKLGIAGLAALLVAALILLPMAARRNDTKEDVLIRFQPHETNTNRIQKIGGKEHIAASYDVNFTGAEKLAIIADLYQDGKPVRNLCTRVFEDPGKTEVLKVNFSRKYLDENKTVAQCEVSVKLGKETAESGPVRIQTDEFLNSTLWATYRGEGLEIHKSNSSDRGYARLESLLFVQGYINAPRGERTRMIWMPGYDVTQVGGDRYCIHVAMVPLSGLDVLEIREPVLPSQLPDGSVLADDAGLNEVEAITLNYLNTLKERIENAASPKSNLSKPFTVYGSVKNERGELMPGVTVRASCGMGTLMPTGRTLTDANGKYELSFGPGINSPGRDIPLQAATIYAEKDGFYELNLCRNGNLAISGKPVDPNSPRLGSYAGLVVPDSKYKLDFRMAPAARIEGQVKKAEGPAADLRFTMTGDNLYPSTSVLANIETDALGRFVVENVPLEEFRFQMPGSKPLPLEIEKPGPYGVEILCERNPEETFEFKSISVRPPGESAVSKDTTDGAEAAMTVRVRHADETPVSRAKIHLEVFVGGDVNDDENYRRYVKTTGDNGVAIFEAIPAGTAHVGRLFTLDDGSGGIPYALSHEFEIKPGEEYEITLGGKGWPVTGKLVPAGDSAGHINWTVAELQLDLRAAPMSMGFLEHDSKILNKLFEAEGSNTFSKRSLTIEPDGGFKIEGVRPGRYMLRLKHPEHEVDGWNLFHEFVVPLTEDGEGSAALDLGELPVRTGANLPASGEPADEKPAHAGVISGVVTDAGTGEPVAGAYVGVGDFGDSGGSNYSRHREQGLYAKDTTDAQGRFELDGLAPAQPHPLVVTHPDYVRHDELVELSEGSPSARVQVALRKAAQVDVSVVDSAGKPVEGPWMFLLQDLSGRRFIPPDADPHLSSFASSIWRTRPEKGKTGYSFKPLASGAYKVEAVRVQMTGGRIEWFWHGGVDRVELEAGESKSVAIEPENNGTILAVRTPAESFAGLKTPQDAFDKLVKDKPVRGMVCVSKNVDLCVWDMGRLYHVEDARLGRIQQQTMFYGPVEPGGLFMVRNFPPGGYSVFSMANANVVMAVSSAAVELEQGDKIEVEPGIPEIDGPAEVKMHTFDRMVDLRNRDYSAAEICEVLTAATSVSFSADAAIENETIPMPGGKMTAWSIVEHMFRVRNWGLREAGSNMLLVIPAKKLSTEVKPYIPDQPSQTNAPESVASNAERQLQAAIDAFWAAVESGDMNKIEQTAETGWMTAQSGSAADAMARLRKALHECRAKGIDIGRCEQYRVFGDEAVGITRNAPTDQMLVYYLRRSGGKWRLGRLIDNVGKEATMVEVVEMLRLRMALLVDEASLAETR